MTDSHIQKENLTLPTDLSAGPAWLAKQRSDALSRFNEYPLPTRGIHLWRYTDPSKFFGKEPADKNNRLSVGDNQPKVDEDNLLELVKNKEFAALVVDRDGRDIAVLGSDESLQTLGVVTESLAQAASRNDEHVAKLLYELVGAKTGKLEALNGAMWRDGIFVYIPDGVTIEKPIYLLRKLSDEAGSYFPRLMVVVGKNAQVTLIDDYSGGPTEESGNIATSNGAVEIFGDSDSRVCYVSLQGLNNGSRSYLTHRARIRRNANIITMPLIFGSSDSKQNLGIILDGEGARSEIYGLQFARGYQHLDTHTLHHHAANRTSSNIDLKVVLKDKANSAYTGLISIDKKAAGCEAYQTNRNLLLNSGCKAETIPELEILNEDVSCSHGATVGPVDPEMVFYLKCRGITEDEAVRMIVDGFVASTLELVPTELRSFIAGIIDSKLQSG